MQNVPSGIAVGGRYRCCALRHHRPSCALSVPAPSWRICQFSQDSYKDASLHREIGIPIAGWLAQIELRICLHASTVLFEV
jgi:hypothetical protein